MKQPQPPLGHPDGSFPFVFTPIWWVPNILHSQFGAKKDWWLIKKNIKNMIVYFMIVLTLFHFHKETTRS